MNVENQPLVEPSKIFLPSTHLKLGLKKNCVKVMNQGQAAFTYLQETFPRLSEAQSEVFSNKKNFTVVFG